MIGLKFATLFGLAIIFALSVTVEAAAATSSAEDKKHRGVRGLAKGGGTQVAICHKPPDNPSNFHTIMISTNAKAAHIAHGDLEGLCNDHCMDLCPCLEAEANASDCEEVGCPTCNPSASPSDVPSELPSESPSESPSNVPSIIPSEIPSASPSNVPSEIPSASPSNVPSEIPSASPSNVPSEIPSASPSNVPSEIPSASPSNVPSEIPSASPSMIVITSDFSTTPNDAILYGNAAIVNGECVLTPNEYSNRGALLLGGTLLTPTVFKAQWDYRVFDGNGADGISFNYGPMTSADAFGNNNHPYGSGVAIEYGMKGAALKVSFIEYPSPKVELQYFDVLIKSVEFVLMDANYRPVVVEVGTGSVAVSIGGTNVFTESLSTTDYATINKAGWRFGFGGRTGAVKNKHSIDNLVIASP